MRERPTTMASRNSRNGSIRSGTAASASDRSGIMSGILASRPNLSSSSSSSEESETGMSSRESSSSSDESDLGILDEQSDVSSIRDMPSRISGRGALIGGVRLPPAEQQEEEAPSPPGQDDLESGVEAPPDSDFAPVCQAPTTLFPVSDEENRDENNSNNDKQRSFGKLPSWLSKSKKSSGPPSSTSHSSGSAGGVVAGDEKGNFERFADEVSESERSTKRPKLWYVLGGVSILLVGAVIAVAVLMANRGGMTPQQEQLSEIAKSISSPEDLGNKASPQAKAYEWLVYEDKLWADANEIPRDMAVQRYVLAVFYFSTSGPFSWEDNSNWLKGSECLSEWTGLNCNDQSEVRAVAFGKSVTGGFCSMFSTVG